MNQKFLITSALPYANGPIHFGHIAGAYLPADIHARFQRLIGSDVLYICGSDEYGVAITLSAEQAGRTPKEHVDMYHQINQKLFCDLDFSFDHYSRTTAEVHASTVREFFCDLLANGHIEEKIEDHLFSEKENRFLADRYVVGHCPKCDFEMARGDECQKCGASYEACDLKEPRSKLSGDKLILKPSKHWYLRFDHFKERIRNWMEKKNFKSNVLNFAKGYVDDLRPRAITRDTSWGIPVPLKEAEGKVFYVWFDAPIGYISATKEWAEKQQEPDKWKSYWMDEHCKLIHFIGKDNIPFHTVFFPAMLMGQNKAYILPEDVPANEFLLLEGRPFSKSDGWSIDLGDFFQHYTSDQIRYYLAANAPESSDADFSWKDFQNRCNSELLAKLGNFVHRTLLFSARYCSGVMPQILDMTQEDETFLDTIQKFTDIAFEAFSNSHNRKACQALMELAQAGNVYFDHKKPWKLAKDNNTKQQMLNVIGCCMQCIKNLAIIAFPIIPKTADQIWNFLGFDGSLQEEDWDKATKAVISPGQPFRKAEVLFQKIEDEQIEKEIVKLGDKSLASKT